MIGAAGILAQAYGRPNIFARCMHVARAIIDDQSGASHDTTSNAAETVAISYGCLFLQYILPHAAVWGTTKTSLLLNTL